MSQCFNPLPAVGPGDTILVGFHDGIEIVSIRSRLLGREIRYLPALSMRPTSVSIRSRLLGREIQTQPSSSAGFLSFQSAPGCWAGRYRQMDSNRQSSTSFNPLPAVGPGDTAKNPWPCRYWNVSIRSRLLGREIPQPTNDKHSAAMFQSAPGCWAGRYVADCDISDFKGVSIRSRLLGREILVHDNYKIAFNEFQSAPGCWAGRYRQAITDSLAVLVFQSAPGCWAGRYASPPLPRPAYPCFNPLPAVGPGDTNQPA